jgi:CBS domain-containing protein
MMYANDVMTRAVATATPKTPVSQVATMMRDLNIGDILIVEQGKLRGIVTDRDLTINVLTNGADTKAPVEKYMTTDVVTGSPDWSLEQVADVMGKYQVRRLPIVQNDNVVGIVSLGDVAVHTAKRDTVANSLKNISEVTRTRFNQASPLAKVVSVLIPVGIGVAVFMFANTQPGKRVRKQLQESDLADQARGVISDAVDMLQDPKTREAALEALEATGLPHKTRQLLADSADVLYDSQKRITKGASDYSQSASEFAAQLADDARKRAKKFPKTVTRRFQKRQPKRFLFA